MANDFHAIEVQLLAWTKSTSRKGPTVTLLLQDDADVEWFETLTLAKGKTAGQLLDAAFRLSAQDDQPTPERKGGRLAQQAGMLCHDPEFQRFAAVRLGVSAANDERAAEYLRYACAISSRAELDHDPEAAKQFAELRTEFLRWKQGRVV